MPRPRKLLPRYLRHTSGRARALWNDSTGPRIRLLPGAFNSTESLQAFARLQLEIATAPELPARTSAGPTLVEILLPYLRHAEPYYGPGSELKAIKSALKTARELYGREPIAEFGPKRLAAVREAFIRKGWARQYVNRQVGKIIRAVKWAVSEEVAPAAVYQALKTLAPLRRGHCEAPESAPRLPANPEHVAATHPFLPPHVRAIVELLRTTGMRPAEVCRMTLDQIERTTSPWIYCPDAHKKVHRGHHRTVAPGAVAQALLTTYLEGRTIGEAEALFSPRRQRLERMEKPGKKKSKTGRVLGERYSVHALGRAINVGAKKASVPPWSAYQLRHLKGAELRERFSLEHVRAALGHSHASMTAHYAKGADGILAAEVASAMG